jgi:hypothetical protein
MMPAVRRGQARRLLWGLCGAMGAFAAVAAGWQALGTVGPGQLAFAGVAAVLGGAVAFYQAGAGERQATPLPRLSVPRQLPRDIADFTGRVGELDELRHLLTKPKSNRVSGPIVAIAGKDQLPRPSGCAATGIPAAWLVPGHGLHGMGAGCADGRAVR